MRSVKNKSKDIERKRPIFFQLGLIGALALSVAAFQWTNYSERELYYKAAIGEDDRFVVESQPVFIPTKPKPKNQQDRSKSNQFDVVDDILEGTDEKADDADEPVLELDIPSGGDDCLDCEEEDLSFSTLNAIEVANKPHYKVCLGSESILDCTKERIVANVLSRARFPASEKARNNQGTVHVQFTVSELGYVEDVIVVDSLSPAFDKEAVRAVRSLPKLEPGTTEDGTAVRTIFTIPVRFRLR